LTAKKKKKSKIFTIFAKKSLSLQKIAFDILKSPLHMKKITLLLSLMALSFCLTAQKETIITGKSKHEFIDRIPFFRDTLPFLHTMFYRPSPGPRPKEEGLFKQRFSVESHQVAEIANQRIFITPGDSVFFVADTMTLYGWQRTILRFSGENAAHYNWDYMLDSVLASLPHSFSEGDDRIVNHKKQILERRNKSYDFLESYRQTYAISDEFYNFARAGIKNHYIVGLFWRIGAGEFEKNELPLDYFDGDTETYLILLNSFVSNVPEVLDMMRNVSEATIKNYHVAVHRLKGTTAHIGAEELSSSAYKMEVMAKSGDVNGLLAINDAYIKQIEKL
jgi:HPt (histidine-containing phosphotransfer) domain-containing protein